MPLKKTLVDFQEDDLTIEERMELDQDDTKPEEAAVEIDDNAIDNTELKKELKTEQVKKALQLMQEASDLLFESDPDQERFLAFNQGINTVSNVYKTWLTTEKSKNIKQKTSKTSLPKNENIYLLACIVFMFHIVF